MSNKKLEFSMKIDIPTILLLLTITAGGIYKFAEVETSVALNTQKIQTNTAEITELKDDTHKMFERIDNKLDLMIEIIHSYQLKNE